ncbi:MAG: VIT1/CCC1 transporter family protein [Deltaproteobacteria bacterium]|nr:VIT1/CCC1 transporter family protein [Deltaproteobacteria bacterium]
MHEHTHHAIQKRLSEKAQPSYLGDFMLGSIDGLVTTFAVIAGVVGARLQLEVALILGVANLVADGFSMAVSNFFRSKSDQEIIEKARQMEKKHIELIPEGEKEEVRQIFKAKGFEGVTLDNIVKTITSDEKRWIDTMLVEELGLRIENPHPLKSALATFISFCFVGVIPLLPLLASYFIEIPKIYTVSAVMTFITFYLLGYFKGRYLDLGHPPLISGFETLFLGGGAATLAYAIGHFIKMIL